MQITSKNHNMTVESVVSTTIRRNGKSYPALKFIFAEKVTAEDVAALTSGNITVGEDAHEGYTTLDEISLTVGKITTAEQQRDEIENELTATKAEHEEYKGAVSTILPVLDDETALSVKTLFPVWEDCVKLGTVEADEGYRFVYNGKLYKCRKANPTFQIDWIPGVGTEALYEIIDETHDGTVDDPIPYEGNMALENGKYYTQDDVVYLCNRDTGNPVYNALSELVGLYVEVYTAE